MSMLDILDTALQSANVAYHEFLARFDATKRSVYGFVEGKDDPSFYRSVVERFLPEDWSVEIFIAGNRKKVLDTEDVFDWSRFSRAQIGFFVDRDLVQFLRPDLSYAYNVYVTDKYSIENSIVTSEMLTRLLQEVYNIVDWTKEEKNSISSHFDQQLHDFVELLAPISAQIAIWRRDDIRANLSNFDLNSVFAVNNGKVTAKPGYDDPESQVIRLSECVGAACSSTEDRVIMEHQLRQENLADLTRGKYLLWFLAVIADDFHLNINNYVSSYPNPPKKKMALGHNNIVVVAAPRARIPMSLRGFLEKTFIAYTGHAGKTG